MQLCVGLIVLIVSGVVQCQTQFRVIKEWSYVNYTWPSEEALRSAMAVGEYHPANCVMTGLGYFNGYYYIATPRMFDGVPVTLSRIPKDGDTAPNLEPFPSWQKNRLGDCDALQNVQNIQIDSDGVMYVIDSGRIQTLAQRSANVCAPKLLKFDLKRMDGEELAAEVFKYEFPENVARSNANYLYDLVVDDNFVYISDNSAQDPGLIVFAETNMSSWKFRHGTFKADNDAVSISVSGERIESHLNLAGLALGPQTDSGRLLYYSPLSSFRIFGVQTSDLQNSAMRTLKNVQLIGNKESQTDGMTADDKGVLYYGLIGSSSVGQWNTSAVFRPKVIARDPKYVQWPNSFTFNADKELVVLGSALVKFIKRKVNLNDVNFRLLAGNVNASSYIAHRFKSNEDAHLYDVSTMDTSVNDLLISDDDMRDENALANRAIANHVRLMHVVLVALTLRIALILW